MGDSLSHLDDLLPELSREYKWSFGKCRAAFHPLSLYGSQVTRRSTSAGEMPDRPDSDQVPYLNRALFVLFKLSQFSAFLYFLFRLVCMLGHLA